MAGRTSLRLRDEKIGLIESHGSTYYCLIFQATDDGFPANKVLSKQLPLARKHTKPVPAWVMPKAPPRTKGELLHPAKFPESLISRFIDVFTSPKDWIFDP